MKKLLILGLITLMLITPVIGAANEIKKESQKISTYEEFTHTVFVEYCSRSTCEPCVTASSQMFSIFNSGDLDFLYVTLISDKGNTQITDRLEELEVVAVPIVFFDGKFKKNIGEKPDEQPYRNNIALAGEREVVDVDIDVNVIWQGDGNLKITVVVYNNAPEEFIGRLRTYIIEEESRWNDQSETPYHYAAIDIPINSELVLASSQSKSNGSTHTFKKTWDGSLYGFDDITKENIQVIAVVFDEETDFVVESATSGEPTEETSTYQISNQLFKKIITKRLITLFPILAKLLSLE